MTYEHFVIKIGKKGFEQEVTDIYPALLSLEVELDDELASMFKLRIATFLQSDGTWRDLDDKRLTLWNSVIIAAGFEGGKIDSLMTGYITHIRPQFDIDPTLCTLEIWGMDESVLMDQEEQLKAWPNEKDSNIASILFRKYSLIPKVTNTKVVHDEKVSTIIQRETDMQFLQRLALRNGFECYVEEGKGYFRSLPANAPSQPVLAVYFGDETNVNDFSLEVNALTPTNVAMFQVDRINKEILETEIKTSQLTALGATKATDLLKKKQGQLYVGMNAATGIPEMKALCQGLFDQGEWFVTGEGEVAANKYQYVLKPRKNVTIKGIGKTHSGVYYVSHVTHSFTPERYTQHFRVKRNGIELTGKEKF